ncbi:VOC family protein [Actinophytocola sediminis]
MTDPLDALYSPTTPVDPPAVFAARLRLALTSAVYAGATTPAAPPPVRPPSLTPYLVVADARAALAWYAEVFGGHRHGEAHENADGTIGHAELGLGDAVLMLAEPSALYPEVPVRAPDAPSVFSHTLHLLVEDVDATVALASRRAASVERAPVDEPYGRAAVIVDPFGHRWLVTRPTG